MSETSQLPFAVFGATGQQGGAVVDALLDRGAAVRAIVRDRDSVPAKALSARGVNVVSADHDDAVAMTAEAIAERIGEHLGKPARFDELPLGALGSDTDRQTMFRWFVETPAYHADSTRPNTSTPPYST